jgi:predicted enzyme related to lactoylglutathione lyase
MPAPPRRRNMAEEPKPGSIVHVELPTKDPATLKRFYGEVFGWTFQDVPELNYVLWNAPTAPGGGFRIPGEEDPGGILNYLLVESIDATAPRIEGAGGQVLVPRSEVPETGWFAIFRDPAGNVMGLWEERPKEEGGAETP